MVGFTTYPRAGIFVAVIVTCGFIAVNCMNRKEGDHVVIKNFKGEQFAGSASCINCHKDIYNSQVHTAHYLTSRLPEEKYIRGSFVAPDNRFAFNKSVVVAMEKRSDGFYQVEYFQDAEKKAKRFDLVIGSGTMGQSYLTWNGNKLYQLPITFFTAAHTWSNSPGFPDKVVFNRGITSRCLECHTTFVGMASEPDIMPEEFDHDRLILGVDCEKCHGPAQQHVTFQTENPKETKGRFITNPSSLSRQQNLDLCASCHGGRLSKLKPSFTFTVGDRLSDYFMVDATIRKPDQVDVHGNQYGLLRASKCFRMSLTLTCSSCHNTHVNEKSQTEIFSSRCITCHSNVHQGKQDAIRQSLGDAIASNCIDCHMPLKPSKAIAVQLQGQELPVAAMIRSHFISIYPDETKVQLEKMHQANNKVKRKMSLK